jgi:hypothetical protein
MLRWVLRGHARPCPAPAAGRLLAARKRSRVAVRFRGRVSAWPAALRMRLRDRNRSSQIIDPVTT